MAERKSEWGWQFLLGVAASLVATGLAPILASYFEVLNEERYLPLWGFLTIFTVLIVGCAWVVFLTTRDLRERLADHNAAESEWEAALQERDSSMGEHLQHWAQAEKGFKDRITELEGELVERDKVDYRDGLYYRPSDTGSRQPFCRICWDTEGTLTTIVEQQAYEDGSRSYQCPVCEQWHILPRIPVADPDAYEPLEEDGYRREPGS